ncbi:MAG: succinate--CoA ligase subunit alpha [Planctomycetes bacterium]|nr:succinate--CoA ligase subunit alpha [Planctomycetota bacterium]
MAIIIDETKRVLVQGITGREGRARTRLMVGYGTNVVAGCTPGKGGQNVLEVPVFDAVSEAMDHARAHSGGEIDISVVLVPARYVKGAAIEAIEAGVKMLVLVPDRVPVWDAMEIAAAAGSNGARFVGPNTLGVISPGRAVVGMIGGKAESARAWFKPGPVGVISRSGGMSSSTAYYLGRKATGHQASGNSEGIGTSTICHVGGDSVLGLRIPDVALLFEEDEQTEAIVLFGEIGGTQEEDLAELMRAGQVTKPVVAYIGGKAAREGTRFSHAGAIIEGNTGTHAGKVSALRDAGATVVESFGDLPDATASVLGKGT